MPRGQRWRLLGWCHLCSFLDWRTWAGLLLAVVFAFVGQIAVRYTIPSWTSRHAPLYGLWAAVAAWLVGEPSVMENSRARVEATGAETVSRICAGIAGTICGSRGDGVRSVGTWLPLLQAEITNNQTSNNETKDKKPRVCTAGALPFVSLFEISLFLQSPRRATAARGRYFTALTGKSKRCDFAFHLCRHGITDRGIVECSGFGLAVGDGPVEEIDQRFGLAGVFGVGRDLCKKSDS